jgi:hypothetical protein
MYNKHEFRAVRLAGAESVRQIMQPIWHWLEYAPVHSQRGLDTVPACRQVRFCVALQRECMIGSALKTILCSVQGPVRKCMRAPRADAV